MAREDAAEVEHVSVREDLVATPEKCSSCNGNLREGKCEDCHREFGPRTQVDEPLEPPTIIPLSPERPPITFPVSEPPPFVPTPPAAGGTLPANNPPVQGDVAERVSGWRRVGLVTCAAIALALPVLVGQLWSQASPDPLAEFSAITSFSTSDRQIEDWSRRQFAASGEPEATNRIGRAKGALEQCMAAAIARDAGRPVDWIQVASWANIARALGVHDADMLELAADLNVQVAIYAPEIPEVDGLERLARARNLLQMRRDAARDSSEVMRLERKLRDLDEMEFTIREIRGIRR